MKKFIFISLTLLCADSICLAKTVSVPGLIIAYADTTEVDFQLPVIKTAKAPYPEWEGKYAPDFIAIQGGRLNYIDKETQKKHPLVGRDGLRIEFEYESKAVVMLALLNNLFLGTKPKAKMQLGRQKPPRYVFLIPNPKYQNSTKIYDYYYYELLYVTTASGTSSSTNGQLLHVDVELESDGVLVFLEFPEKHFRPWCPSFNEGKACGYTID